MQAIQTQEFDFTIKSNKKEFGKWKSGIAAIPFPKGYFIDELLMDDEDRAEVAIVATYQFVDIDEDTWFWVSVLFKKDWTASLHFTSNYSIGDEHRLLPVVNSSLERMGLEPQTELNAPEEKEFATWQEGYNFLCDTARKLKVPTFSEAV